MAARTGMSSIISLSRILIQDTNSSSYDLDDDTMQTILDEHSEYATYHLLTPRNYDASEGGFTVASSDFNWWEGANTPTDSTSIVIKQITDDETITPSALDLRRGIFTFSTSQNIPLYISRGYTYDVYAAASQMCEILIAKIRSEYTFSTNEGSFQRNQRVDTLKELSMKYAARKRLMSLSNEAPFNISEMQYTRRNNMYWWVE